MSQMSRLRIAAYALGMLAVLVVGVWSLRGAAADAGPGGDGAAARIGGGGGAVDGGAGADGADGAAGTDTGVSVVAPPAAAPVVHVAGAVRHTGVYRLPNGSRVEDAVHRAGGATDDADLDGINLAAKVADGQQVVVPQAAATPAGAAPAGGGGAASAGPEAPAAPVGLNAATLEQLQTLDGVGPATAEKIVAWRTEHGGFRSVDDLGQVPGIGPKRLAALRDHVQP